MIFVAWVPEHTAYSEGSAAYEIEAESHKRAVEIARERFAGTFGGRFITVEPDPVRSASWPKPAPARRFLIEAAQ